MNIKYPSDYCVYDTETTGLDTATCRVVELAVKRVVGGHSEIFSWLIKPDTPLTEAELKVCRDITGIDPLQLEAEGIPMLDAVEKFKQVTDGLPLVGHNILRYDNNIMKRFTLLSNENCVDTAAIYKNDKLGLARIWNEGHVEHALRVLETRMPGLKFNLAHACASLAIDVTGIVAHRAAGDVEMTDRLYRKMALGL